MTGRKFVQTSNLNFDFLLSILFFIVQFVLLKVENNADYNKVSIKHA